ncbi:FAD-binding oxidoreductase [Castellaniella sp.]|uniref:FAD-binding oxidoreductase n=1 Tax=Castellaniella sp. TaxID=1955812 RepID=UPI003567058A
MDKNLLDDFLLQLKAAVGDAHVITHASDVEPYLVDEERRYQGHALCVVRPANTAEVSRVLALCYEAGIAVVPQGGNTGLCGGATPVTDTDAIVLALGRMNKIRSVDPLNNTMAVDAGCVLAAIQAAAAAADRLFPMSLGSEGSCQIGGNIATNAGGTAVLRYGPMRDLVLGIEAVLPDGRVIDAMRALRKDNTGYALKHLFIGSEGTLGVITGAVLQLFAKPRSEAVGLAGLNDIDAALQLLHDIQGRAGHRLTNFELLSAAQYELVMALPRKPDDPLSARHPWTAIVELTDPDPAASLDDELATLLYDAMEQGVITEGILATSQAQARQIWEIRHSVTEANHRAGRSLSHDTSVPVSRIPDFVREVEQQMAERFPIARLIFVGHAGDGNIHAEVILPRDSAEVKDLEQVAARINHTISEVAVSLGGSISAEHGIGRLRRAELHAWLNPTDLELMRGIKTLFDPKGLMNPGVIV